MTNFEIIKESVSVPRAAEFYGINSRRGFCRCLFHDEKSPSMKLYDKNYHCFGCGAHGDVIALTAKIFGTSVLEAAKRINLDFSLGIDMDKPLSHSQITMITRRREEEIEYKEWESNAWNVLTDYCKLLREWRSRYEPLDPEDDVDPLYVEALKNFDYSDYLFDKFVRSDRSERIAMKDEVNEIEDKLCEYRRNLIACVDTGRENSERAAVL